ncbi:hypothetical protein DMA11_01025 [Marinilabiliaceae bacterium JC017]|nr:hypothetical protein DMA11_01025 [Marinilabiliaceae bacterium JC017]
MRIKSYFKIRFIGSLVIVFVTIGIALLSGCHQKFSSGKVQSETALSESEQLQDDVIGKWKRTDGDYTIAIIAFNDSTIEAAYFNLQPINVSDTKWKQKDGYLYFLITLHDVNYQGSYYSLGYYPEEQRLFGFYHLGSTGQRFEVVFEKFQ